MPVEQQPAVRIEISDGASIPDSREKRVITAWSISLLGAISVLAYMCVVYPDICWEMVKHLFSAGKGEDVWSVILAQEGVAVTFRVTLCSISLAIPIGLLVGLGRLSKNTFINLVASTYVEVIRGIPLLVQLFFIFYSLSYYLNVPGEAAAIFGLSFCYGAYLGEVFRAGISAVPKGQTEAARSLGFNRFETMIYIILPQAWRTILPPVGNECIAMLKDTSLISVLGLTDIFRIARETTAVSFEYFKCYTIIALVYLIITLILSKGVSIMEARLSYYDKR